jgi:cytoplasmic iron level regulating protein YaaA (DUF328/UPF0246 family)
MQPKNVSLVLGLLLPPSEGKALGGDGPGFDPGDGRFGSLRAQRTEVLMALRAVDGGDTALLGVTGAHLDRARSANLTAEGAPTMPAGARYTGVVWDHLDLVSLPRAARVRASEAVVVVSGLLGVVAVDDPVPDYRLKMGASLAPFGVMSRWWRPTVTETLVAWARGRFVVDLLPEEHRAAFRPEPGIIDGVAVRFVERSGKVAGHDAKAAKGRLARHLLTSRAHPHRALRSWQDDRFDLDVRPL